MLCTPLTVIFGRTGDPTGTEAQPATAVLFVESAYHSWVEQQWILTLLNCLLIDNNGIVHLLQPEATDILESPTELVLT